MPAVIDIGNTLIKAGFFEGDELTKSERFEHDKVDMLIPLLKKVSSCLISSVVPSKATELQNLLLKEGIKTEILNREYPFSLKIEYTTPETLGIDRLCGAEGACKLLKKEGKPFGENDFVLSIDAGTATTINFVKYPGIFAGGIIAPGITMMFGSLNKNTSQLPGVKAEEYKDLIGKSTASSIASGVMNSAAGLIDRAVNHLLTNEDAGNIYVYITGGNAGKIIPFLNFDFKYEPNLVLYGINSVYLNGIHRKG